MVWLFVSVCLLQFLTVYPAPVDVDEIQITTTDAPPDSVSDIWTGQEGFIIGDTDINSHRNAISDSHMRWPSGRVPYVINNAFSAEVNSTILMAMREIEYDVNDPTAPCIQFVPRTMETNYIEVYPGIGCYSTIGMMNEGRQSVSLGKGCEAKGIILHELLHVLGFWHEQNRFDRDLYININLTNVQIDQQPDFTRASTSMMAPLSTPYDFTSIMHYGPYTLAMDKSIPVITPKPGQAVGIQMGQRLTLSDLDVIKIQRLYECPEDSSHIRRPVVTNNLVSCNFGFGMCNLDLDNTSTFQWTIMKGQSEAGPLAGNSNGEDPYLIATASGHSGGVARIITPSYNGGPVCVDFFLYQKGPSSYLDLVATGSRIARARVKSFQGSSENKWTHIRISINIPSGIDFQLTFEAHTESGDVAIDDLNIYQGECL